MEKEKKKERKQRQSHQTETIIKECLDYKEILVPLHFILFFLSYHLGLH